MILRRIIILLSILLAILVAILAVAHLKPSMPLTADPEAVDVKAADLNAVERDLDDSSNYSLATIECWFDADWRQSIKCARLQTPADNGRFSLPVVVIKAPAARQQAAPVLYLSGGPGDSAHMQAENISYWLAWYERAGLDGDLVLVDRRGTGLSVPSLDCQAYTDFSRQILAENVSLKEELSHGQEVIRECLKTLKEKGFDISHFGTRQSAEDLRALMLALGYQRWHLYGVSYGTRLGLELLELAPNRTVSAVLDSVYPKGKGRLTEWPWLLDLSLRNLFRYCLKLEGCEQNPDVFEAKFWQALAVLKQTPLKLTVKSWHNHAPYSVLVNDHRFLSAVFDALYDRVLAEKIPAAVDAALARDSQGLRSLIEPFVNYAFDPEFNSMVFMAVECSETSWVDESAYLAEVKKYSRLQAYTKDLWKYDSCRDWVSEPNKEIPERQTIEPFRHIPTLMLAGGLDPITPGIWAEELHRGWSGSQVLLFPEVGHSVVGNEDCAHGLLGTFFRTPAKIVSMADCVEP